MTAYVIASYDVTDGERYQDYVAKVAPLLASHGGELLVADAEAHCFEGEQRTVHVLCRFETEEAALGWYHDPAYAPVRQIRFDSSANGSLVIAKGFVPPDE